MKVLFIILLFSTSLWAAPNDRAIGFSLGNPTGLNGKYWLDNEMAIDGGAGWSFGKNADFSIHSDFLKHELGVFIFNDKDPLDFYYGLGGRMEFSDDIELGVRIPIGIAHKFEQRPADLFGEVAPIIDFVGKYGIELHILLGGRYYF